jgi:hypothetical protein
MNQTNDQDIVELLVNSCITNNIFEDNVIEVLSPRLPCNNLELNAENIFAADITSKTKNMVIPADTCVDYWKDNNINAQRATAYAALLNRLSEISENAVIEFEWSEPQKTVELLFAKIHNIASYNDRIARTGDFVADFILDDLVARVLSGPTDLSYANFENPDKTQGDPLRWVYTATSIVLYWEFLTLLLPQLNESISYSLINTSTDLVGYDVWKHGSDYGIDALEVFKSHTTSYWESLNEIVTNR